MRKIVSLLLFLLPILATAQLPYTPQMIGFAGYDATNSVWRSVLTGTTTFQLGFTPQVYGLAGFNTGTSSWYPLAVDTSGNLIISGASCTGCALLASPNTYTANGAASTPVAYYTGSLFTGGTGTTTLPFALFQPSGTTAVTGWSTSGTIFGVNAPTGFSGEYLDIWINGTTHVAHLNNTALYIGTINSINGGAIGSLSLGTATAAASLVRNTANAFDVLQLVDANASSTGNILSLLNSGGVSKDAFTYQGHYYQSSDAVRGWSSTTASSGTVDLAISRGAAGVLSVGNGAQGNATGVVQSQALQMAGTQSISITTCTATGAVGGAAAGKFTIGTGGTGCVLTITPGKTAPNGWFCSAHNLTTNNDKWDMQSSTTTTCVLTGNATANDVIVWQAAIAF